MRSATIVALLTLSLILCPSLAHASPGDTLMIRSVLIIRAAPGFPDNIAHRDPIEAAMVNGTWTPPSAGESIRYDDTSRGTWEAVTADSAGWFDHPSLDGGYVFASVDMGSQATMLLAAMGNSMVYVNRTPRSGNPYCFKDEYEPWEPRFDYSLLPVNLKGGRNELLFHCSRGRFKARLIRPRSEVLLNTLDLTLPDFVTKKHLDAWGGIVVINASVLPLKECVLDLSIAGDAAGNDSLPLIQPYSVRKVRFHVRRKGPDSPGTLAVRLTLRKGSATLDTATIALRVVTPADPRKETFVSSIDGSIQYYAVTPSPASGGPHALFLSLHGASVEAINQAASYAPKSWGIIVAPTNRRPYGFNWEDWGRWDALEVLALSKQRYNIDESRVYLTGHSMGGHGTYHVGSLFPDQFAAIGPSAGWISFWTYRVREKFDSPTPMRQMLMRATLPSETYMLAANYKRLGVYVLHGSEDDNVSPDQSRQMVKHLAGFHKDFIYHEEQGAGHWWDNSGAPGADCVDWAPMFDFFARHARPTADRIRHIEFVTPGPGVSADCDWVTVEAQAEQFKLSTVDLLFKPGINRITGSTTNIACLSIDTGPLYTAGPLGIAIDSTRLSAVGPAGKGARIYLYNRGAGWEAGPQPPPGLKSPSRAGTFKDLFRNRVIFVYGTKGDESENKWAFEKARFDAERFWYQGNGSIEVIPDKDFRPERDSERNVVLYGNANTNGAWSHLLGSSPLQVTRAGVTLGTHSFKGGDLACLVIRPRPGSADACVGAVAGTGITGMRLTDRMPYLLPGVAYPDVVIGRASMLSEGESGMEAAGFFGLDWSVEKGEFVYFFF